jgi:hypothetical protein
MHCLPSIDSFPMFDEWIIAKWFCQYICRLIFRFDLVDGDFRSVHVTSKMKESDVEVLSSWSILWEFGNLDCPAVILKDLAMYFRRMRRRSISDVSMRSNFLE